MITTDELLLSRFLRDELSPEQQQQVTDRLETDAEFKRLLLQEKQLFDALGEDSWQAITNKKAKEVQEYAQVFDTASTKKLQETIQEAQTTYNKQQQKTSKNIVKLLYPIMAVAAIVVFVLLVYRTEPMSTTAAFATYMQETALPSVHTRGNSDNRLAKAKTFFDAQNYDQALAVLVELPTYDAGVYIYKGLSYLYLENYMQAEKAFDDLIKSDLLDAEKGYWFKALLYLKQGDKQKAQFVLHKIIDNKYYNYQKARELLKKLN